MNAEQVIPEKEKNTPFKIICKVSLILAVTFVILRLISWVFIVIAFRPLYKNHFSESEKLTIASELDIPAGKISVEKMRYSHGQESCFNIYITASSLDILDLYEYHGNNYDDNSYYIKKDDDPDNDIYCTVTSGQPYQLEFILLTWNENLYDMIKTN
ncbi:MAG: hypothetical protein IJ050_10865 [Clostridia bacterium]|nr:hypothetical protein [Clostridia bacterium]